MGSHVSISAMTSIQQRSTERKKVSSIFTSGKVSATMVIPIDTAKRYGLTDGSHVTIEEIPDGILIRKLKI
jgi:hypothetical protein